MTGHRAPSHPDDPARPRRSRLSRLAAATAAALLLAWAAAAPAAAQAVLREDGLREEAGSFDILVGPIRAGVLGFSALTNGRDYAARGILRSTGLIGAMVQVSYEATSRGVVRGNRLQPLSYTERANTGTRVSEAEMEFRGGVPQVKVYNPPRAPRPGDVDPRTQRGTIDPMTAFFKVLRDVPRSDLCNLDFFMFDGARRSRIVLSQPVQNGRGIDCSGAYYRVAGFSEAEMADRTRFPFTLIYVPVGEDSWRLEEIRAMSTFGPARLRRTQ